MSETCIDSTRQSKFGPRLSFGKQNSVSTWINLRFYLQYLKDYGVKFGDELLTAKCKYTESCDMIFHWIT